MRRRCEPPLKGGEGEADDQPTAAGSLRPKPLSAVHLVRDAPEGQARTTRTAIIEAAWRLFADRGYVAPSIEEIAAAAGLSRATVFTAVGGKPVLLEAAFDVAIVGDDEPVSLPDRAWSRAIRAEPDPRLYLALYAGLVTEAGGRVAPIAEAVRGAAR